MHYLPCSFDNGTVEKANVGRYFTPTIQESNNTQSNGLQGYNAAQIAIVKGIILYLLYDSTASIV